MQSKVNIFKIISLNCDLAFIKKVANHHPWPPFYVLKVAKGNKTNHGSKNTLCGFEVKGKLLVVHMLTYRSQSF